MRIRLMSLLLLSNLGCTVHLHLHIGEDNYEIDKKKLIEVANDIKHFSDDNKHPSTRPAQGLENGSDGSSWLRDWLDDGSRLSNE